MGQMPLEVSRLLVVVVIDSTTEVGRAGAEAVAVLVAAVSETFTVLVVELAAPGESGQIMPVVQTRLAGQHPPPIFTGHA